MRTHDLYQKFIKGTKLSDEELLVGMDVFKDAADALFKLGPYFNIAAKEANSVYLRFRDFAIARGIMKGE